MPSSLSSTKRTSSDELEFPLESRCSTRAILSVPLRMGMMMLISGGRFSPAGQRSGAATPASASPPSVPLSFTFHGFLSDASYGFGEDDGMYRQIRLGDSPCMPQPWFRRRPAGS